MEATPDSPQLQDEDDEWMKFRLISVINRMRRDHEYSLKMRQEVIRNYKLSYRAALNPEHPGQVQTSIHTQNNLDMQAAGTSGNPNQPATTRNSSPPFQARDPNPYEVNPINPKYTSIDC